MLSRLRHQVHGGHADAPVGTPSVLRCACTVLYVVCVPTDGCGCPPRTGRFSSVLTTFHRTYGDLRPSVNGPAHRAPRGDNGTNATVSGSGSGSGSRGRSSTSSGGGSGSGSGSGSGDGSGSGSGDGSGSGSGDGSGTGTGTGGGSGSGSGSGTGTGSGNGNGSGSGSGSGTGTGSAMASASGITGSTRLGMNRLVTLFHARNAACVLGGSLSAYMVLTHKRFVESHQSAPVFVFQGEKWMRDVPFSGRLKRCGGVKFIHTDLHDYLYGMLCGARCRHCTAVVYTSHPHVECPGTAPQPCSICAGWKSRWSTHLCVERSCRKITTFCHLILR